MFDALNTAGAILQTVPQPERLKNIETAIQTFKVLKTLKV
jgi:hypothetical protein